MAKQTITPYLVVPRVSELIAYLKAVFDAEVVMGPMIREDGSIMHAQVQIGTSSIMMSEPQQKGSDIPAMLYVYVEDCDESYRKALAAGGTSVQPPEDQPHGDRYCGVTDPCGNQWWMAQELRQMSREEIEQSYA